MVHEISAYVQQNDLNSEGNAYKAKQAQACFGTLKSPDFA